MSKARIGLLGFLFLAPWFFLIGAGSYHLWSTGWLFWAWWPMFLSFALAYFLGWRWTRRKGFLPTTDTAPPNCARDSLVRRPSSVGNNHSSRMFLAAMRVFRSSGVRRLAARLTCAPRDAIAGIGPVRSAHPSCCPVHSRSGSLIRRHRVPFCCATSLPTYAPNGVCRSRTQLRVVRRAGRIRRARPRLARLPARH